MKAILGIIIGAAIVVSVIALYCALVIAGKETDRENVELKKVCEKKICPNCLTGAESYMLDRHSPECPYLYCHNGKKCPFYKPLSKDDKTCLFIKEQKVSIKNDIPKSVAVK